VRSNVAPGSVVVGLQVTLSSSPEGEKERERKSKAGQRRHRGTD
jgi:hypothetical protein